MYLDRKKERINKIKK